MKYFYLTLLSIFLSVTSFAITPITGVAKVCMSSTTKLTDATTGGMWSSATTTIASVDTTGLVTGVSAGTTTISYSIGSVHAVVTVTVNLYAPIVGITTVCAGGSTVLTDINLGGVWNSSNTALANAVPGYGFADINSTAAGIDTVTYTLPTGCAASSIITINPLPGPIIGSTKVCVGSVTTLTDAAYNGTWSSSISAKALAGLLSGDITGVAPGVATITYTLPTGCLITTLMTVNANPAPITGVLHAFHGNQATVSDLTPGGTWAVNYPSIATIGSTTGIVTGVSSGFVNLTYTQTSTGCSAYAKFSVDGFPDSGATFPIVAWYPFCNDLLDHSGNSNTLTNTAAVLDVDRAGYPNSAYLFNGTTSILKYTTPFPLATASGDFTLSAWIKPTAAQSSIIAFDGDINTDGIGLVMNSGTINTPGTNVGIYVGGGSLYVSIPLPALNVWYSLVMEKSTVNGTIALYINNVFEGLFVSTLTTPTMGFAIGNDITGGAGNGFIGDIDDVSFFNDGLTDLQRTDLINFNPDIIPFTLGNDTIICSPSITLAPTPQEPGTYYVWGNGDSLSTSIVVDPPPGTTAYSLSISKPYGCTTTEAIAVLRNPLHIFIGNDTSICLGDTVDVSALYTSATYLWNTGATASFIPVTQTGSYWVTVDSGGCVGSDTINVAAYVSPKINLGPDVSSCQGQPDTIWNQYNSFDAGYTYLWSNGSNGDSLITTVTGTFWLQITNGQCSRTDTMHVLIVFDTFSLLSKDTAICLGRFVTANSTYNPIVSYQWTPTAGIPYPTSTLPSPNITPDTSATYIVTGRFMGCPDISYSFHIDVEPYPIVSIGGNRQVCTFDTLHILADVSPDWYTGYIYNWSPAGNIDFPNSQNVVFTAGDSTDLILTVSTPAGCVGSDSAFIVVHPTDFDSLVLDVNVCPNDSVLLLPIMHTIGNGVGTIASYVWHPGAFVSDSTSSTPWLHAITSGGYTAIGTSKYGCKDTLSFAVTVDPAAIIYLGDSATLHPGESYQISPQTNCVYFSWFPPRGLNDTSISDPVANPSLNTKYIVHGTTENGCTTADSINIHVDPGTLLAVPNAFTPGGTVNGILYIIMKGKATLNYFRIYNRWGVLVFDGNNVNSGWDGTYKGVAQPFDVYVYQIEATTSDGQVFQQSGNVTLIR